MKRNLMELVGAICAGLTFVCIIAAGLALEYWKCSEMFPHAPIACMLRGGR